MGKQRWTFDVTGGTGIFVSFGAVGPEEFYPFPRLFTQADPIRVEETIDVEEFYLPIERTFGTALNSVAHVAPRKDASRAQ
jgi:hypothetical protein